MKNILFIALFLITLGAILYSQDSRGFIVPTERSGQPRPTPPSCCRPFRSNQVLMSNNVLGSGNVYMGNIPIVLIEEDVAKYMKSLEDYRKNVDLLLKTKKIEKPEYTKLMLTYKIRVSEANIEKYQAELNKINANN